MKNEEKQLAARQGGKVFQVAGIASAKVLR